MVIYLVILPTSTILSKGIVRVIDGIPQINDGETISPKVYNIGCGHPMSLMDFIHTLEEHLGMKAPNVYATYAKR